MYTFITFHDDTDRHKYPQAYHNLSNPLWHQKDWYGYDYVAYTAKHKHNWCHFDDYQLDSIIANLFNHQWLLKYSEIMYPNHKSHRLTIDELKPQSNGTCVGCQQAADNYGGQIKLIALTNYNRPKQALEIQANGIITAHNLKPLQIQYIWPAAIHNLPKSIQSISSQRSLNHESTQNINHSSVSNQIRFPFVIKTRRD